MMMKMSILTPCLLLLTMFYFVQERAYAQEDNTATIAKYKDENAVITSNTEHLIIRNEGGKLVATSEVVQERLLISDMSPGMYNSDYIFHSYFNKLEEYDAVAFVPSNGSYKKVKDYISRTNPSEDDNIFYDDAKHTEITFTGLTKHSLIRTSYTITHLDLHMLPHFYFQENLPAAKLVFEVTAPKYVNLNFVLKGEHTSWIKQTKEESKNTITYTFTATDVPALKEYSDLPSVAYYMPHVIPYITSYQLPKDDKPTPMLRDPSELYAYFYDYLRHVNVTEDEQLSKTALELTKNDNNPRDKAKHIYQWVQKNIHYIAFEDSLGGFVPRQAADICKRKFGDCKDMASILTAMCMKVGIEAYFTWIGTRHKPYTYEETPLPLVSNHMICTIKLGEEWVFLDGTDSYIPFGFNPSGIQGKEAMVAIDEKHYKILTVPETPAAVNVLNDTTYMKVSGLGVSGNVVLNYKGYPAWNIEYALDYYKNAQREKYIRDYTSRGSNKYVQKGYNVMQLDNENKDIYVNSDFTIDNYVQNAGKESFVNMNLSRGFENSWIEIKDRTTPVSHKYKCKIKEVVVLDIPKGFTATYVPPDDSRMLSNAWSYSISYKSSPDKIMLIKEFELNTLALPASQFEENNKMVERLRKQYKESIVLTAK